MYHAYRILLLITLSVAFFGCSAKREDHSPSPVTILNKGGDAGSTETSMELEFAIESLKASTPIQGRHIGIDGKVSGSYSVYEQFKALASDSLLIQLLQDSSPKMRVYSMWALSERNNKLAKTKSYLFDSDSTLVEFQEGDIQLPMKLKDLALRYLQ